MVHITKPSSLEPTALPANNTDNFKHERKSFQRKLTGSKLLLLISLLLGIIYWFWQSQWIVTYGRVMSPEIHIAATQIGRIHAIKVKEGQYVKKGQLLVLLEHNRLSMQLKASQLLLNKGELRLLGLTTRGINSIIQARVDTAKKLLEEARQRLKSARTDYFRQAKIVKFSKNEVVRVENLKRLGGVSQTTLTNSKKSVVNAKAEFTIAKAFKDEMQAAYERAEIAFIQALKNQVFSQSKLADTINLQRLENQRIELLILNAQTRLEETHIIAPIAGMVSWLNKRAGDVVDHRDIIMNIMDTSTLWVEAYVDTDEWSDITPNQISAVKVNQEVDAWLNTCVRMVFPTQRPIDQEFPVGPRLSRSSRRIGDYIRPVKLLFLEKLPEEHGLQAGMKVSVKIKRKSATTDFSCPTHLPIDKPDD